MKQGYVKHDQEVSEVMTELAEDYMPGVVWFELDGVVPTVTKEQPVKRQFAAQLVPGVRL